MEAGLNVAAGEEVRWLPRRRARGLSVPVNDYWVFDDRLVRFGYFGGDGTYLDDELTDDPDAVHTCAEAFERVKVYKTPWQGDPRVNIQCGKDGNAKAYQVRQVLDAIARLDAERNEEDDDDA